MNNNQNGNKTTKKERKKWVVGTAVVATISLMAMGTSALASSDRDVFKGFFKGNTEISAGSATLINQSSVMAGIKTTVEESIIGGNSAIIIVSFEHEDGAVFPQDAAIATLELDWAKDASYMVEQRVTEDGKKIIAMFDVDTPSSLKGKKVTIKADAVVNSITGAVIAKGPFHTTFTAQESSTAYNIGIDQTLSHQQEKLSLQTINFSTIGIGIEGERLDGHSDQLPEYNPKISISTSDGKETELYLGSTSTSDRGFEWHYNLDKEGKRIFLDTAVITSISIDGHIIPVTK
ncbi:hypothetical protein PAECIP111892_04907 [Paenibacillus auburnensis]|uniref:DUF4179 domain-containing protein n=1 Tax=Paenibacillus auburnensis TaxID=2905649 RepID=A0ABN8GXC9_9BACL|nr:hypothetical protein [Paenibacillus auburnensis]CAH1220731.1 hypothetical protein PAECIP111892_04907 [Paenibacillus auburnensis]